MDILYSLVFAVLTVEGAVQMAESVRALRREDQRLKSLQDQRVGYTDRGRRFAGRLIEDAEFKEIE